MSSRTRPHQRARLEVGIRAELFDYSPCPTAHPYPGPLLFSLVRDMLPIRLVVEGCQRVLTWLLLHATGIMTDGNVRPEQDMNDKEALFSRFADVYCRTSWIRHRRVARGQATRFLLRIAQTTCDLRRRELPLCCGEHTSGSNPPVAYSVSSLQKTTGWPKY